MWLGSEYLLSNNIVLSVIISFYITGMRRSVWTFYEAYGLFWYDRFKPLLESIINLISSIILARILGMQGIIIGTIISTLTTAFWIEPYVLYKYGFKTSVIPYFFDYFKKLCIVSLTGTITWFISCISDEPTIGSFIFKLLSCLIIPNLIYIFIFRGQNELKYMYQVIKKIILRKLNEEK